MAVDASGAAPRDYLLVNIQGLRAKAYAQAFFQTLGAFYSGTEQDKADAQHILDDFATAAQRRFPALGTVGWGMTREERARLRPTRPKAGPK